jgi:hypothetical protein
MDVLEEIRHGLANLDCSGRMLPITTLPSTAPAWVFREDAVFGVAVALPDGPQVAEGFAGAKLVTADRLVDGTPNRLLRLESSIEALRNEFAVVCAQMVTPGQDGAMRAQLVASPLAWWERWRHLLGNAMVSQTSYSTLGELLAIESLTKRGEQVEWRGPLGGSIDIVTQSADYEVKSTISRYDFRIHVAGQFQLALSGNRPLNLLHYRFEPSGTGDSVNSVCCRLVAAGFPAAVLEDLLTRCGLEAGCAARFETFTLLESRLFPVDDAFPRITPESFATGTLPSGVVQVEYQVDLTGLAQQPF